jgi:hypothetical protein
MQTNLPTDHSKDFTEELSLIDIIRFFQESWKIITSFTLLGIAGATLYLAIVPKQYEATAQIKMAQIANPNNITIPGVNIEEPQALIARMALPTSYPKETIALCGLAEHKDPEVALANKVKIGIPKGLGGTVDLKIRDTSKEIAKACTNAVFELIKLSQAEFIAPLIEEASKKLKIEEARLSRATQVITKADKSEPVMTAAYLATRDEIRYLLEKISNLQIIITSNGRPTHLTAPIYLNEEPVFPQKRNSLTVVGILFGSLLGLAFALARKWYRFNYAAPNR